MTAKIDALLHEEITEDDFNIVQADWIGKIIINYGNGGDSNLGYGGALRLKAQILRNEKIVQNVKRMLENRRAIQKSGDTYPVNETAIETLVRALNVE